MTVKLKFQTTGAVPGSGEPILMQGASMSIGRGGENDVVLPDPDRMVSKCHCVIEDQNGRVVIVDLSTNGTFLNYGKVPIGKNPTNLNSGDVLTMGPYELVVEITQERAPHTLAPLSEGPASHGRADRAPDPLDLMEDAGPGGDFLDSLLGPDQSSKGPAQFKTDEADDPFDNLLAPLGDDEDPFFGGAPKDQGYTARDDGADTSSSYSAPKPQAGVIPDDWDDFLDIGNPEEKAPPEERAPRQEKPEPGPVMPDASPFDQEGTAVPHQPEQPPQRSANPPPVEPPPPEPPSPEQPRAAATPTAAPSGADADTIRTFLRTLGVGDLPIAGDDVHPTMIRLANVLRTMVTGIREILMTRASFKGEFHMDRTMIGASGNNPLKFSVTPEQALEAMARPVSKGYLGAEAATEQALQDIKAHEIAMVTGMEAALKGVLKRLDPKALEEKIAERGGVGMFQNKKAKYWETYEAMYSEIADGAQNDFHDLFAREFAAAYKAQLERLK